LLERVDDEDDEEYTVSSCDSKEVFRELIGPRVVVVEVIVDVDVDEACECVVARLLSDILLGSVE
jgi:hypothetical protein